MFNLQGSEIIFILLLALVVLGPEKLPDAIRRFTRTYGELKKMGSGFQSELRSVLDEPVREVRETAGLLRDAADPTKITTAGASNPLGADATKTAPPAAETTGDGRDAAATADPAGDGRDAAERASDSAGDEDVGAASAGDAAPAPGAAVPSDDATVTADPPATAGPEPPLRPTNRIAAANSSESLAQRAEAARPVDLDDADPTGPSDPTDRTVAGAADAAEAAEAADDVAADGAEDDVADGATEGAGAGSRAARA